MEIAPLYKRCTIQRTCDSLTWIDSTNFSFAECSSQNLALGRRCEGASALSGPAASGGMAGSWDQKAYARPILFPTKENPWGVGFGHW